MKRTILSLGSALLLLTNTLHAQEEISFGLKGGGSCFLPAIDTATKNGKDYEGKFNIFAGGGVFFEYRLIEEMLGLGLELGYAKRGIELAEKQSTGSNSTDTKNDYCLDIHALDLTVPITWLPIEREGGLSIFAAPKLYYALATKEKPIGDKDSKDADKELVNSFNWGAAVGVKYEIAESGFFLGANYEYFFRDILGDSNKAKALKTGFGKEENAEFNTRGIHTFLGFDFARLLE